MTCKNSVITLLMFLSSLFFVNNLHAQNRKNIVHLQWREPIAYKITDNYSVRFLNFAGATYLDSSNLPHYLKTFDVIKSDKVPVVELYSDVYEALTSEEEEIIKNYVFALKEKIEIQTRISYQYKIPYLTVDFIPLRKNPLTNKIERLVSFELKMIFDDASSTIPRLKKARQYAANSVLSTGDWYRVDVYRSGLHVITYNDLITLGMNPSAIDPRHIRVYGNGGEMLPEDNSVFRYDDLQENAIMVRGEEDGVFNQDDYIVFYAKGPEKWTYEPVSQIFSHQLNKYSRTASYFITPSLGPGKRVQQVAEITTPATTTITTFKDFAFHEKDSINLIKSGREFYGEVFDMTTSRSFQFNFPNLVPGSTVTLRTATLARSVSNSTNFKVYVNNQKVQDFYISQVSSYYVAPYAKIVYNTSSFTSSNPTMTVRLDYFKNGNPNAVAWLDYIELNAERYLSFLPGQIAFRNPDAQGVAEYVMTNASSGITVWDVTNYISPRKMFTVANGNEIRFKALADSLREFVAFDGSSFYPVSCIGRISNQNLHGLGQYDMIIVSHPDFLTQANRLAEMHRNKDQMTVLVVIPQVIYNEFSSGSQDVTAIKDFVKMFYDRAGSNAALRPKFLLLFGDASYDFLNRVSDNTNFVPTYQSIKSLEPSESFLTDDYFGFLDDLESGPSMNLLDIAIGRLPAKTSEEAEAMVNKIINYTAGYDLISGSNVSCSDFSNTISNFNEWRNVLCFVADDNDVPGEDFLKQSENIAKYVDSVYGVFNIEKIYIDAFTEVSTPGGQRYPEVTEAINNRVAKGALIINYIGHGGEVGWAHEAILGVSDINSWTNRNNHPIFVTATCEFSRFDDPARTSAGEYVLLNPNGGGIALFTTTRLSYAGSNFTLNYSFFQNVFDKSFGDYPYLGQTIMNSKNDMNCAGVISNFVLLGDPAIRPALPKYNVVTSSINAKPLNGLNDTIRALEKITIGGYIADNNGVKINDYKGTIYPIIFDKPVKLYSNGNGGSTPQSFTLQKNIIFKGKASIHNGEFSFSFVVPKDIAYKYGKGKISYYAKNQNTDANGFYKDFIIGGTSNNPITDNLGPEIKLYLNDTKFVSGGITNNRPVLLAYLSDSAGLNTVGNGIGHDISAVIDNNTDNTIVLNDYYESDMDTYQSGVVTYPFSKLPIGLHNLRVKAWDIYNNSSEKDIDFVVAESAELALNHVLNYPNPFTTYTEFWFEHNQPCCNLDVIIQIFTISGKLIKTISTSVLTNGFRAEPIPWDGRDDFGDPIAKGVYVYVLKVRNSQGQYAQKIEKLVILK